MPENIQCGSCGQVVLGFTAPSLRPVDGETCPGCGGEEFERIE